MGTAIKHPVPDQIKLSFVIFDIQALWRSAPYAKCGRERVKLHLAMSELYLVVHEQEGMSW